MAARISITAGRGEWRAVKLFASTAPARPMLNRLRVEPDPDAGEDGGALILATNGHVLTRVAIPASRVDGDLGKGIDFPATLIPNRGVKGEFTVSLGAPDGDGAREVTVSDDPSTVHKVEAAQYPDWRRIWPDMDARGVGRMPELNGEHLRRIGQAIKYVSTFSGEDGYCRIRWLPDPDPDRCVVWQAAKMPLQGLIMPLMDGGQWKPVDVGPLGDERETAETLAEQHRQIEALTRKLGEGGAPDVRAVREESDAFAAQLATAEAEIGELRDKLSEARADFKREFDLAAEVPTLRERNATLRDRLGELAEERDSAAMRAEEAVKDAQRADERAQGFDAANRDLGERVAELEESLSEVTARLRDAQDEISALQGEGPDDPPTGGTGAGPRVRDAAREAGDLFRKVVLRVRCVASRGLREASAGLGMAADVVGCSS